MSRTRVIINADDLGLAEGVNRGIVEAIAQGAVTSASFMVNLPAAADAARRLSTLTKRQPSIGLHFNLVAGTPLTRCPTLTDARSGRFLSLSRLMARAIAGRVDKADVERELDAQFRAANDYLRPLSLAVTHIDSHRHAHCLPPCFDVVAAFARGHGIRHVRRPVERYPVKPRRLRAIVASSLVEFALGSQAGLGDFAFTGTALMGSLTLDRDLDELLSSLPAGTTELMVHPGYDSADLAAIDPYRAPRERELRALMSPAFARRAEELGVEFVSFAATTA